MLFLWLEHNDSIEIASKKKRQNHNLREEYSGFCFASHSYLNDGCVYVCVGLCKCISVPFVNRYQHAFTKIKLDNTHQILLYSALEGFFKSRTDFLTEMSFPFFLSSYIVDAVVIFYTWHWC